MVQSLDSAKRPDTGGFEMRSPPPASLADLLMPVV